MQNEYEKTPKFNPPPLTNDDVEFVEVKIPSNAVIQYVNSVSSDKVNIKTESSINANDFETLHNMEVNVSISGYQKKVAITPKEKEVITIEVIKREKKILEKNILEMLTDIKISMVSKLKM